MKFVLLYDIFLSAFIFLASALPFNNGKDFNRFAPKVESIDDGRQFVDDSRRAFQSDYENPEPNSDDEDELLAFDPTTESIVFDDKEDNLQSSHQTVAFMSYLDHRVTMNNQVLIFNRILYNAGAAYNVHTGIFIVPKCGTYIFSFRFEDWELHGDMHAYLMVDSLNKAGGIINPSSKITQLGNTAILGLKSGQSVWVKVTRGSVFGDTNQLYTTFTGAFLL